ncbi:MAG: hypothetical protein LAE24_04805 [Candidatus Contendobacter sp.]|jgi:hypothetical protein|nr:hypothetical protein [Candidatus Contendobacter sp.]
MSESNPTGLAAVPDTRSFIRLTLDDRQWLVPRTEAQGLASLLDLDREVRAPHSLGALGIAGEWWPVYCLSGELRRLPGLPAARQVCLLLNNGVDQLGLACDQVDTVTESIHLHPVPVCMTPPDSPILALAVLERGLGCVTTTEQLARRIATFKDDANG